MRLKPLALFAVASILAHSGSLAATQLRLAASVGFGSTSSSNEVTESEGPLVQIYDFEYVFNTKNVFGVEHYRSFNPSGMQTSIAFSGLSYRWYLNNVPGPYADLQAMPVNTFQVRDLCYYIGGAFGVAQASLPPNEQDQVANAAGLYLDPKLGMELALSSHYGFRTELNFLMTVMGTGSVSGMSLSAGVYYFF